MQSNCVELMSAEQGGDQNDTQSAEKQNAYEQATGKNYSRNAGYDAADKDKEKMEATDMGELYDKYYQTIGVNDAANWDFPTMPNMNSHKL